MSPVSGHHLAAMLQRVLLPPGLPDIQSWAVAALYQPAGEAVLVGGDFYDWFTLRNGRVLFLVGDVSGKGPIAGALAMSIRKALKGITRVTPDLATALPILRDALDDELQDAFASLCLLEITPGGNEVRLMLAGHPPPLIRRRGVFQEVAAPENGLFGHGLQERWESAWLAVEPGDMLVLYSDGLTDARIAGGGFFGEGPFQALLERLPPGLSSYDFVMEVDAGLGRVGAELTDDMILAALRFQPGPA